MLSFQWFPIKEHMFWLFSIFQLVFHLASIGFFMFFFFLFLLAGAEALHISGLAACCHASVEADLPGTGSRWGTAATWMMGDLAALKRASRVFTKNHGGFVFFFWTRKKRQKEGLEMVTYVLAFSGIGFSGKINGDHQRSGGLGAFLLFWLEGGMAGRPIMIMGTSGDSQPAQT